MDWKQRRRGKKTRRAGPDFSSLPGLVIRQLLAQGPRIDGTESGRGYDGWRQTCSLGDLLVYGERKKLAGKSLSRDYDDGFDTQRRSVAKLDEELNSSARSTGAYVPRCVAIRSM